MLGEAYLATRKRVSLARHARLLDYHLARGQPVEHLARARDRRRSDAIQPRRPAARRLDRRALPLPESVFFASRRTLAAGGAAPALRSARQHAAPAHLAQRAAGAACREHERRRRARHRRCRPGRGRQAARPRCEAASCARSSIAEQLNPLTGRPPGRDRAKRQLLRLRSGATGPFAAQTDRRPADRHLPRAPALAAR